MKKWLRECGDQAKALITIGTLISLVISGVAFITINEVKALDNRLTGFQLQYDYDQLEILKYKRQDRLRDLEADYGAGCLQAPENIKLICRDLIQEIENIERKQDDMRKEGG